MNSQYDKWPNSGRLGLPWCQENSCIQHEATPADLSVLLVKLINYTNFLLCVYVRTRCGKPEDLERYSSRGRKKKRYWRTPSHNNCVMSRVGGEIQHQQLEWSWVGVLVRVSADPLASVQVKAHSRNHRLEVKTRGETWGRRGEGEWGCVLRPLCEDISLILSKSHTTVAFDAPAAWPAAVEKLCNTCAPPVFLG